MTNGIESHILLDKPADRRLLVVFAHPDDETFGPGGTLARYTAEGVAVHYACATRGEVGEIDAELLAGYRDAADLRTQELFCAARILGLSSIHFLNYRDSGMAGSPHNRHNASLVSAPRAEVVGKIVYLIRQLQPQVVLTFDPTGGYFHPDHVAIHEAATEAFHAAGDPERYPEHFEQGLQTFQPNRLYYHTFPRRFLKAMIALMTLLGRDPSAFGRNKDIDLRRIAEVTQPITTRINIRPYFEARVKASSCHHSQGGGRGIGPWWLQRWLFSNDSFTRAFPPIDGGNNSRVETDLFERTP